MNAKIALIALFWLKVLSSAQAFQTRSIDGTNNFRARPEQGATGSYFSRQMAHLVSYADGISSLMDGPNPRDVVSWASSPLQEVLGIARAQSNALFSSKKFQYNAYKVSYLAAAHGQAIAHDLILTNPSSPPEIVTIPVRSAAHGLTLAYRLL